MQTPGAFVGFKISMVFTLAYPPARFSDLGAGVRQCIERLRGRTGEERGFSVANVVPLD